MGGNIWDSSSRLDSKSYHELCKKFEIGYFVIPSYFQKESFGDLDIVHSKSRDVYDPYMTSHFDVIDSSKNGKVESYLIDLGNSKHFQVDLIYCPKDELDFSYKYFAWNDCGNLIGRLAHRIGLKFGHDGLWYVQRDKNNVLFEHLLTRDFYEALDYLDLDWYKHACGFETPEEIYDFIVKSKYFDYQSVDLNRRNNVSRTRDKKRVMYTNFIKYLKEHNLTDYNINLKEKEDYLYQHFNKFVDFECEYFRVQSEYEEKRMIAKKFNGNIVSQITGLSGKELGMFMSICKRQTWYTQDILYLQDYQVKRHIENLYREICVDNKEG